MVNKSNSLSDLQNLLDSKVKETGSGGSHVSGSSIPGIHRVDRTSKRDRILSPQSSGIVSNNSYFSLGIDANKIDYTSIPMKEISDAGVYSCFTGEKEGRFSDKELSGMNIYSHIGGNLPKDSSYQMMLTEKRKMNSLRDDRFNEKNKPNFEFAKAFQDYLILDYDKRLSKIRENRKSKNLEDSVSNLIQKTSDLTKESKRDVAVTYNSDTYEMRKNPNLGSIMEDVYEDIPSPDNEPKEKSQKNIYGSNVVRDIIESMPEGDAKRKVIFEFENNNVQYVNVDEEEISNTNTQSTNEYTPSFPLDSVDATQSTPRRQEGSVQPTGRSIDDFVLGSSEFDRDAFLGLPEVKLGDYIKLNVNVGKLYGIQRKIERNKSNISKEDRIVLSGIGLGEVDKKKLLISQYAKVFQDYSKAFQDAKVDTHNSREESRFELWSEKESLSDLKEDYSPVLSQRDSRMTRLGNAFYDSIPFVNKRVIDSETAEKNVALGIADHEISLVKNKISAQKSRIRNDTFTLYELTFNKYIADGEVNRMKEASARMTWTRDKFVKLVA